PAAGAPVAPAEAPDFGVSEEALAAEPSSAPVVDDKQDALLADADDARERFMNDRMDAPEAAEFDAAHFQSQPKPRAVKEELAKDKIESLGYLDEVGAGERGGRLAGSRTAADAAVPSRGVRVQAQESSQVRSKEVALFEAKSRLTSADAGQVLTLSEALQERNEILGLPFNEEPADMELRKTASSARRLGFVGGGVADGERSLADRFEDRVELALDQLTPIKTVRIRSYKVEADGSWVETGYDGEPTTLLKRGSKDVEALIALDPDIKRIVQRPVRAIFQVAGRWYTLEEAKEGN
ncbi:MAG: hypothetical protein QGD90_09755, partial [Candidatus Hydrogenedentes bacterium]|nr:hypothetical protein [Candidatus Hydrogenedentota bacterium]